MGTAGIDPWANLNNPSAAGAPPVGGAAAAGAANPTSPAAGRGYYTGISSRTPATAAPGQGPGATAGAYWDPNQLLHPQGAGGGAAPMFDPGQAGRYTAFLNRLPVGQAGAGTDPTLMAAIQRQLTSGGNLTNPYLDPAAQASAQDRAGQQGAMLALTRAGAPAAAAQQALLGQGMAQSAQVRGQQLQAAQAAMGAGQPYANQQAQLANMLMASSMGQGPSAAQAQLQSGLDQSIAAQHALAAGVRGQGAGAAMANATRQGEDMGLRNAATSAALRAQEQQSARDQLAGVLATGRQQDLGNVMASADVLNATRGGDVGALQALGGLAGTNRAQDIGQANALVDALSGVRGQDINQGVGLGGAYNQLLGLQQQGTAIGLNAGLGLNEQRIQGLGLDIQALLGGGQMMGNYDTNFRGQQLGHEAQQQELTNSYILGGLGLASGAGVGLANAMAKGGAAAG